MAVDAVKAATQAVWKLRSAERLLASSGFYAEADAIRKERQRVERCSATSVEELNPDHGDYSPATIGKIADEQGEEVKHGE
jgi:hypothetical protein